MRKQPTLLTLTGRMTGLGALALSTYWFVLRPKHLRWGATDGELHRILPGDDLVPQAKIAATHAITIKARAEDVWPWIVQMGYGRAGMYSYTWIEKLVGADMHNADRIIAEYQNLKVGDVLPLAPNNFGPKVAALDPHRALVLHGDTRTDDGDSGPKLDTPEDYMAVSWTFFLEARDGGTTRLIERFRCDYNSSPRNSVYYKIFLEPGAAVMERKMLLGIKQRAEAAAREFVVSVPLENDPQYGR